MSRFSFSLRLCVVIGADIACLCWGILSVVLPSWHEGVQEQDWDQLKAEVQYAVALSVTGQTQLEGSKWSG